MSGWIGSALEYYDFFIYTTAAGLIFPEIFFPADDPRMGVIGAMGIYGIAYIVRPIGAFVLGSWGDKHGRKNVLVMCMLLMGVSTVAVAVLPTYQQVGFLAPALLMVLRIIQGFAVAGEISGASSMIMESAPFGRRGFFGSFSLQGTQAGQLLAAAVFLPLATFLPEASFNSWGWRIPFALSVFVIIAGYLIRRNVHETEAFTEESEEGVVPASPIATVFRDNGKQMVLVFCMALTNIIAVTTSVFGAAYATQPGYGINMAKSIYVVIPLVGNALALVLIPIVGNLSDKIGRRPPIMFATLVCGVMSFAYLWSVSQKNVPLAIFFSLLMWGACYQGYNAVFPAFYPEQFPTKTRVTGMAIAQNLGTAVSSFMGVVFTSIVPPAAVDKGEIPPTAAHAVGVVGGITLVICLIAFVGALLSKETFRLHSADCGEPNAQPLPKAEYDRLRAESLAAAKSSV